MPVCGTIFNRVHSSRHAVVLRARRCRRGTSAARPDELRDTALHEEIELVGQLVVAATSTPDRLSQEEIDKVLGVEPED